MLNANSFDLYEIVVKENGAAGFLVCTKNSNLSPGLTFLARFVQIDCDGKYILQGELPSSPHVQGGGMIVRFPIRESD